MSNKFNSNPRCDQPSQDMRTEEKNLAFYNSFVDGASNPGSSRDITNDGSLASSVEFSTKEKVMKGSLSDPQGRANEGEVHFEGDVGDNISESTLEERTQL